MKCPNCELEQSELRDICPKCLFDLRPHKMGLGLGISHPRSTYQELLNRVAPHAGLENPSDPSAVPGILSTFKSLLGSAKAETAHAAASTPEKATRAATTHSEHAAPETPPLSKPPLRPLSEIELLFEEAQNSLLASNGSDHVELSLDNFIRAEKSEELDILFDIAEEVMFDPDFEKRLSEEYIKSSERQLESEFLHSELADLEQFFGSKILSLKGPTLSTVFERARLTGGRERTIPRRPVLAPAMLRLKAGLLDLMVVVLLGLICGLIGYCMTTPHLAEILLGVRSPDLFDLIQFMKMANLSALALLVIYPIAALCASRVTYGMRFYGLSLRQPEGKRVRLSQRILRGLLLFSPIAAVSWLRVFRKRLAWHDLLTDSIPALKG